MLLSMDIVKNRVSSYLCAYMDMHACVCVPTRARAHEGMGQGVKISNEILIMEMSIRTYPLI